MSDVRRRPWHVGFRGRLALSIAAIVIVAFVGAFLAVYRGTGSALRGRIESDLRAEAAALEARLASAPASGAPIRRVAREFVAAQPFGPSARLVIVTIDGAGTVTNQPELVRAAPEPESENHSVRRFEAAEARKLLSPAPGYSSIELVDAGDVRLLTRRLAAPGRPGVTISVGEPLEPVERAQSEVARVFLIAGAITLALALGAVYLVAARAAAPLRRMARIATEVDAGDLRLRIGSDGPHDEVRTLAEAFDHMLDRLEDAFARQRQFVSDASHELRTPLTAIRGQIEVLAAEESPSAARVRSVAVTTGREIARMQRLADDLLALARLDEDGVSRREPIVVERFLTELCEGGGVAEDRRLELGLRAPGTLLGDPDRVAQLVRNLLANATEHTAAGGRIRLAALERGDRLELTVDDDGPGIPEDEHERVFDRFHRIDHGRAGGSGGSGLGLAISHAIVEAHGGRISAAESPLGGARIAVELPGYTEAP